MDDGPGDRIEDALPSGPPLGYRRLVGGARVLLARGSWRLLLWRRVRGHVADLVDAVSAWEGVETRPHRFGGTEFALGGREVGHVHGWGLLDVPYARPIRDAAVGAGEAAPHHVLPDSGWVTDVVDSEAAAAHGRELLRLSYLWHAALYDPDGVDRSTEAVREEVRSLSLGDAVAAAFEAALARRTAADER